MRTLRSSLDLLVVNLKLGVGEAIIDGKKIKLNGNEIIITQDMVIINEVQ